MFPLHVLLFPHNLHLRLRPYARAKQGHAYLLRTSSFTVHVAMSSLHESRSPHLQTLSHAVNSSVTQKDENLRAPDQEYGWGVGGTQCNQIWRLPPGFVTYVRQRRHFHRLLQRRYLSEDRVLTRMCAININVATCQFPHCYLYSGMRNKNVGHYFMSSSRTYIVVSLELILQVRIKICTKI